MNGPNTNKHIHSYVRVKHKDRNDLYKCSDPDCSHRTQKEYIRGKRAKCPYCNELFIVTTKQTNEQKTLHCDDCTRGRGGLGPKKQESKKTLDVFEKLLEGLDLKDGGGKEGGL